VLTRIFFPNTHFDGNNVKEPSKIVGAMRKFYRPYLFKWKWLLIALVLLSVYLYSRSHHITSHLDTLLHEQVEVAEDEFIKCSVIRVVDGDTFHCRLPDGKDEKVRLVGIDTPEIERNPKAIMDAGRSGQDLETIVSLGKKAANFTKSYLKPGATVKLELDVQPRDK
jgi:endonuclease YncB( thermonuclease family)